MTGSRTHIFSDEVGQVDIVRICSYTSVELPLRDAVESQMCLYCRGERNSDSVLPTRGLSSRFATLCKDLSIYLPL